MAIDVLRLPSLEPEPERSSLLASSTSPFRIDFATNADPLALAGSLTKTIRDELDACIGCHECMRACPLEEANAENNPVTIGALNSFAIESGSKAPVTLDFVDHCTQCQACVPVCPVDIHRSRIVLWNKLKRPPESRQTDSDSARGQTLRIATDDWPINQRVCGPSDFGLPFAN